MAILSHAIGILPFVALRYLKSHWEKVALVNYILIASLFQFIDTSLYKSGIISYPLYNIWFGLELLFLSYIILSMLDNTATGKIVVPIVSIMLYLAYAFMIEDMWQVDFSKKYINFGALAIISMLAMMEGVKGWRVFLVTGVFIYSFINLATFPVHHTLANIILNIFLPLSLVTK